MLMNDEYNYALQWDNSAKYFYDNGYYDWMTERIESFHSVLEIGCGTGYSTLALVKKGYKVIAVDKNQECLDKAKSLLNGMGYTDEQVLFIKGDIARDDFRSRLENEYEFDVVACWNIGSYWNAQMIKSYIPYMVEYGLTGEQISANPESSYSELIIWNACRIAKAKNAAAHIIDRSSEDVDNKNDLYYCTLKDEFDFSSIKYNNKAANSLSNGGRVLSTNGSINAEHIIPIVFVSILLK